METKKVVVRQHPKKNPENGMENEVSRDESGFGNMDSRYVHIDMKMMHADRSKVQKKPTTMSEVKISGRG